MTDSAVVQPEGMRSSPAASVLQWVRATLGPQGLLVMLTASTGFAMMPWEGSAYDARYALVAIAAGLWVLAYVLRPDWGWRVDRAVVLAALAAGTAVVLSTAVSPSPVFAAFSEATTEAGAIHWLANLVVFVLAASLPLGRRVATGLIATLAWVIPVAFIGFGQSLFDEVGTVLANADYFVAAMVLHVCLGLAAAHLARNRRVAMAWLVATAFPVLGVVTSGASSGLAGLAVTFVLLAAFVPQVLVLRRAVPGSRVLAAAMIAGLALTQIPAVLRALLQVPLIADVAGYTAISRVRFWEAAASAVSKRPFPGFGPDGYARAVQGLIAPEQLALDSGVLPQFQLPADAHSFVWTLAVLFGIVGVAAFAALGIVWAKRAAERLSLAIGESGSGLHAYASGEELVRGCVVAGFLGYLAVLLFIPMSVLGGSMLSLFAGIAIAPVKGTGDSGSAAKSRRPAYVLVAGALVALSLGALGMLRLVNTTQMHIAQSSPDLGVQLESVERGLRLEPFRAENRFLRLLVLYRMGSNEGDLTEFHAAVDAEPEVVTGYGPYMVFLTMLSLNEADATGRTDIAWERAAFERSRQLAPSLPIVKSSAMQIALIDGDLDAARDALDEMKRVGLPEMYWEVLSQRLEAAQKE